MIDTSSIDLVSLVGMYTKLKKVGWTQGGEFKGPCPLCGGQDRFIVQPRFRHYPRWLCRQCLPRWQDAIAFVMVMDERLTFQEALKILRLNSTSPTISRHTFVSDSDSKYPKPVSLQGDYVALNSPDWQAKAAQFVERAVDCLWSQESQLVLNYLRRRGLSDDVIRKANLGLNFSARNDVWGETDVWLPHGIVIPWNIDGRYWRIRFRRLNDRLQPLEGNYKYTQVRGAANGLYGSNSLRAGCIAVLVESEFDSLVLHTQPTLIQQGLVAVATGGTANARVLRWVVSLSLAKRVLVAFDRDQNEAGDKAAAWWLHHLGSTAIRLGPTHHDVTDMVKAGENLATWIKASL